MMAIHLSGFGGQSLVRLCFLEPRFTHGLTSGVGNLPQGQSLYHENESVHLSAHRPYLVFTLAGAELIITLMGIRFFTVVAVEPCDFNFHFILLYLYIIPSLIYNGGYIPHSLFFVDQSECASGREGHLFRAVIKFQDGFSVSRIIIGTIYVMIMFWKVCRM
jgi:hypothetical protein